MESLDKAIIKRNYLYVIYNIMKDETSLNGKRLSVKDIIDIIQKKYDLLIDKNTVRRVFSDLESFGYDIKKDETGYYLDTRILTDGEMGLLIDGIESLKTLSPDSKIEIYEKLCKVIGKKPESIDYYMYNQEPYYDLEEKLIVIINNIYSAIGKNKCLDLFEPICFKVHLIDELTDEEDKYFNNLIEELHLSYVINPYQIFRSKDNDVFLLFYYKGPSRYLTGTLNLSTLEPYCLDITDKDREKIDVNMLLSKDLTDFTNSRDYLENESILSAQIIRNKFKYDKSVYFEFVLDCCESYEVEEKDGIKIYNIKYKRKKESEIITLCIECYEYVKVLKGNELYEELQKIYNALKYHFGDEKN